MIIVLWATLITLLAVALVELEDTINEKHS